MRSWWVLPCVLLGSAGAAASELAHEPLGSLRLNSDATRYGTSYETVYQLNLQPGATLRLGSLELSALLPLSTSATYPTFCCRLALGNATLAVAQRNASAGVRRWYEASVSLQRFVLLPWGLDRALRPRFEPQLVHEWVLALDRYRSVWDTHARVLSGCLASPTCRAEYTERLRSLSELFESLDLAAAAQAELELLRQAGQADRRKPADDDYAEHCRRLVLEYIAERPAALRAELPALD